MTEMNLNHPEGIFVAKDKISALTHFIGFLLSIAGMPVLLIHASLLGASEVQMIGYAVFMASMILLYGASAAYHSFHISPRIDRVLKKLDHCSIFVLIAGSYTPICLTVLKGESGVILLAAVWIIALLGIVFKLCWVTCPKWVSSVIYTAMGWACLTEFPALLTGLGSGFSLLLLGGIFYTLGAVIYARKKPLFANEKETGFGNHELFHLFVMAGSLCHYLLAYQVLTILL